MKIKEKSIKKKIKIKEKKIIFTTTVSFPSYCFPSFSLH